MGSVSDFLGSTFGIGYIGYKLAKEKQESDSAKRRSELVQRFINKYCDRDLEANLKQMVEDPLQTEKVWETIVGFVKSTDPHSLFLPIEMLDPQYYCDRSQSSMLFGWQEIAQNQRVPFHDRFGRLTVKDNNTNLYLRANRKKAIRFLMMANKKAYCGLTCENAVEVVYDCINKMGMDEFEHKYL